MCGLHAASYLCALHLHTVMRIFFLSTLALLLVVSCTNVSNRKLLIDFNGTLKSPIVLGRIESDDFIPIDTADLRPDGVYLFYIDDIPYGYYRFVADSGVMADLIIDSDTTIKINAIVGRDDWTIAGNKSTATLWHVEKRTKAYSQAIDTLISRTIISGESSSRAAKDSLFAKANKLLDIFKHELDSILSQSSGSLVSIPIMNTSIGNFPLYKITNDFVRFKQTATTLKTKYADVEVVNTFCENVDSIGLVIDADKRYKAGFFLPALPASFIAGKESNVDDKLTIIVVDKCIDLKNDVIEHAISKRLSNNICLYAIDSVCNQDLLLNKINVAVFKLNRSVFIMPSALPIYIVVSPSDSIVYSNIGATIKTLDSGM